MTDQPDLTDEEKLGLRTGLARLTGALMRAWHLGMFVARDAEERRLFDRVAASMAPAPETAHREATSLALRLRPIEEAKPEPGTTDEPPLARISDREFLELFDDLIDRYLGLKELYERGMVSAAGAEQTRQLDELRELLGVSDR